MTIHTLEMDNNTVMHSIVFVVPNEEFYECINGKKDKKEKMFMKNL